MAIDVAAALKTLQATPVPRLRERYAEVFGEPTRSNNKQYRWHPALAHSDEMAPKVPLTHDELATRKAQLQAKPKHHWWQRPALYFLGCDFCKAGWTTLALWLLTGQGAGWFVNTAGYAVSVLAVSGVLADRADRLAPRLDSTVDRCRR